MKLYKHTCNEKLLWLEIGEAENIRIPFDSFYTDKDLRNTTLMNNDRIAVSLWNKASDEFLLLARRKGLEAIK